MAENEYKQFTAQAKSAIKGEAFFETLISDYSLPHHIVGSKDLGIDYICEWAFGDRPTGVLYAVQVKTRCKKYLALEDLGSHINFNELRRYKIKGGNLQIDERTMRYWSGLGMPTYLFVIVYSDIDEKLECFYKRFTPILTSNGTQENQFFYKVNEGAKFLAFANNDTKFGGFARDLFIDLMRCSYYKGSIAYITPRSIGLQQFPEEDVVFGDLFREYYECVCRTYTKTKGFLDRFCGNQQKIVERAIPSAESPEEDI